LTKATWCAAHEPRNAKCAQEWQDICKLSGAGDITCHPMLYGYDTVIDVGNIIEYTLTGLEEGKVYYFAATAYNNDDNESAYSMELAHTFTPSKPGDPTGLKTVDEPPARLTFPKKLDSIKETEKARDELWELIQQKSFKQEGK